VKILRSEFFGNTRSAERRIIDQTIKAREFTAKDWKK
jgi:hypothetical protein